MNLDEVRTELLARKAEIEARVERTHRHTHQKQEAVSPNFSEQIKQTENDSLIMALEQEGMQELAAIRHALTRLEVGTYFCCSQCGLEIGEARLKAIPYTDRCINCADDTPGSQRQN
ncbi:MAG: TraR/DksA family transcriptional regulator [Pseudomonadales bacterium]|nr:TraR/DksA family transcriptional regulator [Pseudomonadales bacterium]